MGPFEAPRSFWKSWLAIAEPKPCPDRRTPFGCVPLPLQECPGAWEGPSSWVPGGLDCGVTGQGRALGGAYCACRAARRSSAAPQPCAEQRRLFRSLGGSESRKSWCPGRGPRPGASVAPGPSARSSQRQAGQCPLSPAQPLISEAQREAGLALLVQGSARRGPSAGSAGLASEEGGAGTSGADPSAATEAGSVAGGGEGSASH